MPIPSDSIFNRQDLAAFDVLVSPIWIFDIERMQIWWANRAALNLCNAQSQEDLGDRDWSQIWQTTRTGLPTDLKELDRDRSIVDCWTFYPQGREVSVRCVCSDIRIESGRLAMWVEGVMDFTEATDTDAKGALECDRDTKMIISIYQLDGTLVMQNAEAIRCYGNEINAVDKSENVLRRRFVDSSVADRVIECVGAGTVFSIQTQVRTLNGIRWHTVEIEETQDAGTGVRMILIGEQDLVELDRAAGTVRQRDRLLEGVAQATNQLLTSRDLDAAITQTLETLGIAAQVDRVYVFANHENAIAGEHLMSQRWEWARETVSADLGNPELQNLSYDAMLPRWYENLSRGKSIVGLVREFPASEREILEPQNIRSILVVPIAIEGQCWGFIGLDDCHSDRHWSESEESILMAVAGSIGGAIARHRTEEQLATLNAQLEQMVEERTAKLKEANEQLRSEIAERARIEEKLRYNAFHDALTGLPNRTLFMEELRQALARSQQNPNYLFAVLFLDLDRFKVVNDSLGHSVGDRLLIEIAERIRKTLAVRPHSFRRNEHVVARLGGDEFAILLKDIRALRTARRVAERIHACLNRPFMLEGQEVFTSVSIGIALSSTGYKHPEELLRDADIVMYRAKALGRSRHEVFDTAMHDRVVRLLKLENDLRRAISDGEKRSPEPNSFSLSSLTNQNDAASNSTDEDSSSLIPNPIYSAPYFLHPVTTGSSFTLHYQPIVALKTGHIEAFEALVRWEHPELGLVSPVEFIPIAEETGLIVPLDRWVLREACTQLQNWQQLLPNLPRLQISVNLSARQFSRSDLIGQIDRILKETDLDGSFLKLEITESAIMDNPDFARGMLLQLRERKIQLCMDDFGTGYSSLSYLHRFPLHTLKIDRSFINRIGIEGDNSEIVKTIVDLASNLGMEVIAEGIETREQWERLQHLGCAMGQGYLFSEPVAREKVTQLLKKDWTLPKSS